MRERVELFLQLGLVRVCRVALVCQCCNGAVLRVHLLLCEHALRSAFLGAVNDRVELLLRIGAARGLLLLLGLLRGLLLFSGTLYAFAGVFGVDVGVGVFVFHLVLLRVLTSRRTHFARLSVPPDTPCVSPRTATKKEPSGFSE